MRVLIVILILLCGGCRTTYDISSCHGDVCTTVHVGSYREFQQPTVTYTRNPDGSVTFSFNAETASTGTSSIEEAFAEVLKGGGAIGATLIPVPPQE